MFINSNITKYYFSYISSEKKKYKTETKQELANVFTTLDYSPLENHGRQALGLDFPHAIKVYN